MGFFERPDPRLSQSAGPTALGAIARKAKQHALAFCVCSVALAGVYAANVALGLHATAPVRGTLVVPGLLAPVTIVRDRRDIPHIRAHNAHDLYFAQGYVEGSDRLFQLDFTRRYAYGRLAEVLGPKALPYDEMQRAADIAGIARRQLQAMAPRDRVAVMAFSEGVNAAARSQRLPVEFRMLYYSPAPWTPQDSLAVSIVASLELAGSWHDVFARDAAWRAHDGRGYDSLFPLSDARYDVTVTGRHDANASRTALVPPHRALGSNAWAAGAARSLDGDALLANDPHLDVTIPGIWYLADLQSPQVHVAGATIPGMPGIVLGHNDRLAWAATNAAMATKSIFEAGRLEKSAWITERFHVRFAHDVRVAYYRTANDFSIPDENDPTRLALVRWPVYAQTSSTIATGLALDRARNVGEALSVLARYRGSPQNFILADRSGAVAYHVAGLVPDDPAWGRYVHRARDLRNAYPPIPFAQLPATAPSRSAVLLSANNKAYAPGYRYRLSAQFEPPYRAYRIAQLLHARSRYDAAYFARMQLDTLSPRDLAIAGDVTRFARTHAATPSEDAAIALLASWDGRYTPDSRAAALEHDLRDDLASHDLLSALQSGAFTSRAWGDVGGMRIEHVLAPMHFTFLDGAWLPGAGDEYTIHLQEPGLAQGFRAVWDTGDWNRGGIAIPSGESGEPGSGHYTDLTTDWIAGVLRPLPFGDAAVRHSATAVLVLLSK